MRSTLHRATRRPLLERLEDRRLPATLYVAVSGSDSNPAGDPNRPLLSIQHAVTVANSGDVIRVSAGTYGYNAAADAEGNYTGNFGTTSVVTLINKQLTIIGGFPTNSWNAPDPAANPTIIDGAGKYRDILAVNGTSPTALTMSGFTVQNGLAQGIPKRGGTDAIDGVGGGMLDDGVPVNLSNMLFQNDRAIGNNTTGTATGVGGAGAGGGLALRSTTSATTGTLQNVTFSGDLAQGGSGDIRGGFGQGGGLFIYQYTVNGGGLTFQNNRAQGGSTNGNGFALNDLADAQGGGLAVHINAVANIDGLTATGNQAVGGAAPNGDAGGSYGGGVYGERATLNLADANVRNNLALGGSGNNGASARAGFGNGGGLMTVNTDTDIERSQFVGNVAKGGDGAVFKGVSGGGGLALVRLAGYTTFARVNNSLIAGNAEVFGGGTDASRGGGGGGLWVDGPNTNILQCTIADNGLVGSDPGSPTQQGQALVIGPAAATTVTVAYSIIADHVNNLGTGRKAAALDVHPGSTVTLNRDLFANNSNDTNQSGPDSAGTINGLANNVFAASAGFASPGSPQYNYQITTSSPAFDAAKGSTETVDINGQPRVGTPDIGAYEALNLATHRVVINDFDGDGKTDLAVYRASAGYWIVRPSGGGGTKVIQMGDPTQGDVAAPGDYDGDGKTDFAVFRPGTATWIVRFSGGGSEVVQMGDPSQHDIAAPGDYDGDGKTDFAVFRPATDTWIIRLSGGGGTKVVQMGDPSQHDTPAPGDFDGDGKTDLAVFRPGSAYWIIRPSGGAATYAVQMGDTTQGDIAAPGDFDGDGKTDLAVFRPGSAYWIIRPSGGAATYAVQMGDASQHDLAAGAHPASQVGGAVVTAGAVQAPKAAVVSFAAAPRAGAARTVFLPAAATPAGPRGAAGALFRS